MFVWLFALCFGIAHGEWGIQFVPSGTVYASYSGWVLSLTMDLHPYHKQFEIISRQVDKLDGMMSTLFLENVSSNTSTEATIALEKMRLDWSRPAKLELRRIKSSQLRLEELLSSLKLASNPIHRTKRALIPLIGDLLSDLFGTASERDLNHLKRGLTVLKNGQSKLAHVVSESLTLLNKTNSEVIDNRKAINHLAVSMKSLDDHIVDIFNHLETDIEPMILNQQITTKLLNSLRLVSDLIKTSLSSIETVQSIMHEVLQGRLPSSLVLPRTLKNILLQIQKELPTGFSLPADPRSMITWYFNNLATTLLPDNGKFHVLTLVPLIQGDALYSLYKIVSVPSPHINQQISAEYIVEGPYIATSATGGKYIILTSIEAERCVNSEVGYCTFTNPVSSVAHMPTCASALFMRDVSLIKQMCRVALTKTIQYPHVKYLLESKWLISTSDPLTIHITCTNRSSASRLRTIHISQPVSILTLGEGCTGYNNFVTLPAYTLTKTSKQVTTSFEKQIALFESLPNIWDMSTNHNKTSATPLEIEDLKLLPDISKLPIEHIKNVIDKKVLTPATGYHVIFQRVSFGFWGMGLLVSCITCIFIIRRKLKHSESYCVRFVKNDKDREAKAENGRVQPVAIPLVNAAPEEDDVVVEECSTETTNKVVPKTDPLNQLTNVAAPMTQLFSFTKKGEDLSFAKKGER